ncbi:ribulose-phosphate 3-epimerase [Petrotoga sp. HKA.pet.4.5]|uniref:ribulose-phosphate 3-epimerase n=1 Tax=Petrotoga sp. HKA.pet.4.5 TaxID=1473155 RepID=UPI000EF1429F|nr:ribulose-phosphate 3-epimerase [Petrotoga sp. HKA.pet.4.5]RLL88708.1 ribulose-phosphate 3-epimerase [Petrotoga sp. HKA.pet.4.5]
MIKIYPSILAADFLNLAQEIEKVSKDADGIHLDIMDGVFVPNITFGFPIVESIRKKFKDIYLDAHLMIVEPDKYLENFSKSVNSITVHYEAVTHLHRTVLKIKELGCEAGVTLNPHTPVSLLEEILPYVDKVLIMSVNPGFTGQHFIETTYEKVRKLRRLSDEKGLNVEIMVDGGVNKQNIGLLHQSGVNTFIIGASVFYSENPSQEIIELKKVAEDFE